MLRLILLNSPGQVDDYFGLPSIPQRLYMESAVERNCWVVARRATFVFVAVIFFVYLTV